MSEHAHMVESLIGADQAAQILSRPVRWVYVEAAAERIPSYKIGGTRRFYASELRDWIRGHAEGPRIAAVTPISRRR